MQYSGSSNPLRDQHVPTSQDVSMLIHFPAEPNVSELNTFQVAKLDKIMNGSRTVVLLTLFTL